MRYSLQMDSTCGKSENLNNQITYFKIKGSYFFHILFYLFSSLYRFCPLFCPLFSVFSFIYLKPLTSSAIPPFCSSETLKRRALELEKRKTLEDQGLVHRHGSLIPLLPRHRHHPHVLRRHWNHTLHQALHQFIAKEKN